MPAQPARDGGADRVWLVYVPATPPTLVEPKPTLCVNGKEILLVPRPKTANSGPQNWTVPMWFADVTEVCNYGGTNQVQLTGSKAEQPSACFITSGSGEGSK